MNMKKEESQKKKSQTVAGFKISRKEWTRFVQSSRANGLTASARLVAFMSLLLSKEDCGNLLFESVSLEEDHEGEMIDPTFRVNSDLLKEFQCHSSQNGFSAKKRFKQIVRLCLSREDCGNSILGKNAFGLESNTKGLSLKRRAYLLNMSIDKKIRQIQYNESRKMQLERELAELQKRFDLLQKRLTSKILKGETQ